MLRTYVHDGTQHVTYIPDPSSLFTLTINSLQLQRNFKLSILLIVWWSTEMSMINGAMLLAVVLLAAHPGYSQLQDTNLVRLVDGPTTHEGRVEVYANGAWGTICDDDFDIKEANVICRMLGYFGALEALGGAYYGQGRGKILMDQLECVGDEESIFNCPINSTIGQHDCTHREDAGVECNSFLTPTQTNRPTVQSLPVRLSCPYNEPCNNIATKRGPDPGECELSVHVEGIVQVYYNKTWWYISANGWDKADVDVVCGQLGYPIAFGTVSNVKQLLPSDKKVRRQAKKEFNTAVKTVLMKNVLCEGTEANLEQCSHPEFGSLKNRGGDVATARCGFQKHPSCDKKCQAVYRLRGGVQPWMGRVEVFHSNRWGTVCDRDFNSESANVLCRSLGYGTVRTVTKRAGYGRGIGKVWIKNLNCNGTESELHKCNGFSWRSSSSQCTGHGTDVGVECNVPNPHYGQKDLVRILPVSRRRNPVLPFVEIADNKSSYGLLCFDDMDVTAAEAMCKSLHRPAFLETYKQGNHSRYSGQRYKGRFICNGNETNIRECKISYQPVAHCDKGDLLLYCDEKRPDLVPSLKRFSDSLRGHYTVQNRSMYYLQCALEDGCLASTAVGQPRDSQRKLLRFDSYTTNYGLRDFTPVLNRNEWIWHQCHRHYHSYEVFVAYNLLDLNGTKVAEGHKASFCLEDSICDSGTSRRYRCGGSAQGISVNCGDLYPRYLDCQWIDITGVPDGSYVVQANVNPTQLVIESDQRNNIIQCAVTLKGSRLTVGRCSHSDHEPVPTCQ